MNADTLNILADAITEIGSWWCWDMKDDVVQVEFVDVLLYDESKPEQEAHTTGVLAIRFRGHAFAAFLDNLDELGWHERFHDDDSILYPIDQFHIGLAFDDAEEAGSVLNDYKNRVPVKGFDGPQTLLASQHLLCTRCGEVGFIVGGDELQVVGAQGKYTGEEIEAAAEEWWAYWKTYWELKGTEAAYPTDYVCEIMIPIRP